MPDRIYTYQQSMIIMKIEELDYLLTHQRIASKKQIFKQYKSLIRRTNRETALPPRLKYKEFCKPEGRKSIWANRIMDETLLDWLTELHRYYDDIASKNAQR